VAIPTALAIAFFAYIGVSAGRIVVSLFALHLGASASMVGLLGGMFYVFPLLLSWPIGLLADRFGSRWLLFAATASGTCAMLLPFFFGTMGALFAAATLSGLSLAFSHVTLQNLVGILSKPHERARNFSNLSLMGATSGFAGPMVAGLAIDHAGHAQAALVIALLCGVGVVLALARSHIFPGGNPQPAASSGALKSLARADVRRMLLASGLVQLGTDIFQFYMPVYGHHIGLSATAIGMVLAAFAAAAFVARVFLPGLLRRMPAEKLLAWTFWVGAAGFALIPLFENAAVLIAIAFVFGLGMGCGTPLTVMLMFSQSAAGGSGQALGLRLTTNNAVRATGPIAFGVIASALGLASVFWISVLTMGLAAVVVRRNAAGRSRP